MTALAREAAHISTALAALRVAVGVGLGVALLTALWHDRPTRTEITHHNVKEMP